MQANAKKTCAGQSKGEEEEKKKKEADMTPSNTHPRQTEISSIQQLPV